MCCSVCHVCIAFKVLCRFIRATGSAGRSTTSLLGRVRTQVPHDRGQATVTFACEAHCTERAVHVVSLAVDDVKPRGGLAQSLEV